jgi:DNA-binding transcriptional regulator YiaG
MNSAEYEAIRAALGLGRGEFARALGVDVRADRAYASGGRPIPKVVALAAWALSMQPRVADARKMLAG